MTDASERTSENVTVVTAFPTVSSLKSEDSTEQLICKTPQAPKKGGKSVSSKSVEAGSDKSDGAKRLVVFLGLAQVVLGALLVGAGALAVVKGAALARVGAGLWAGCIAVVGGVVGVLAGINDCYGLNNTSSSPLLTAFLALSLLGLACGHSAAVLAATGLQRDSLRPTPPTPTFEDEMQAWTPVLTNISVLIIAAAHCLLCVLCIYHLSKRVCPCFRPKQAFDHNQFDPTFKAVPCVFHVDEVKKAYEKETMKGHELCKELEMKLHVDTIKKKKDEPPEYGSANSKEKLVTRWLGRHHAVVPVTRPRKPAGVRKARKLPPAPVMLVPAHPAHPAHAAHAASTLGRVPVSVLLPPRYATLPLPAPYPPLYYPVPDNRVRRRRSPRPARSERAARAVRGAAREGRDGQGARGGRGRGASQLTRSLERIHRQRAAHEQPSVDDLKRTYTGLDRAYAEQFIAVCDESRHAGDQPDQHDSLATTNTTATNTTATDSTDSHQTR